MQYLKTGTQLQAMDVSIEWAIEGVLPKNAITIVAGKGGIGKTMLLLDMADSVSKGVPFLDRPTIKMPVYFGDFENPVPVTADRARTLNVTDVLFWLQGFEYPPPRIDSNNYGMWKMLPPGLVIIDSLRASQMGDENSSKDMAFVMQRYKELRDYGHTLEIIHHTIKANEMSFRGSMAILDLADHVLSFFPVRRPGDDTPIEGDDLNTMTFYLGTREKTRFSQVKMYVRRANGRFEIAEHPDDGKLSDMVSLLREHGQLKQQEFLKAINDQLGIGNNAGRRLLRTGTQREIWKITRGEKNSCLYQFVCYPPINRGDKTDKQDSGSFLIPNKQADKNSPKPLDTSKFVCFSDGGLTNRQTGDEDFPPEDDIPDVEVIA